MIWLIGNKGMLGREIESLLERKESFYIATDQEVDITSLDELRIFATDKPISWIINCAAYTAVDKAEVESDLAFKINAEGTHNIAKIAENKGAKLIHLSTDYVFDGTKRGAYVETDIPNPLNVYGKSKYQGEAYVHKTLNRYFIIRTAWLYGKHGNNFVYTMLHLFKERDEVSVVGDQYGAPTYAPDLAAAILEIIRLDSDDYGIYHFTNEGKISWFDFACEIYRLAQEGNVSSKKVHIKEISTEDYPTKAKRPKNSLLSKEKIKKTFNIVVPTWQEGLHDFIRTQSPTFFLEYRQLNTLPK